MEQRADRLTPGLVIEDGSWGQYRIVSVKTDEQGWTTVKAVQGRAKRTFLFSPGQVVNLPW